MRRRDLADEDAGALQFEIAAGPHAVRDKPVLRFIGAAVAVVVDKRDLQRVDGFYRALGPVKGLAVRGAVEEGGPEVQREADPPRLVEYGYAFQGPHARTGDANAARAFDVVQHRSGFAGVDNYSDLRAEPARLQRVQPRVEGGRLQVFRRIDAEPVALPVVNEIHEQLLRIPRPLTDRLLQVCQRRGCIHVAQAVIGGVERAAGEEPNARGREPLGPEHVVGIPRETTKRGVEVVAGVAADDEDRLGRSGRQGREHVDKDAHIIALAQVRAFDDIDRGRVRSCLILAVAGDDAAAAVQNEGVVRILPVPRKGPGLVRHRTPAPVVEARVPRVAIEPHVVLDRVVHARVVVMTDKHVVVAVGVDIHEGGHARVHGVGLLDGADFAAIRELHVRPVFQRAVAVVIRVGLFIVEVIRRGYCKVGPPVLIQIADRKVLDEVHVQWPARGVRQEPVHLECHVVKRVVHDEVAVFVLAAGLVARLCIVVNEHFRHVVIESVKIGRGDAHGQDVRVVRFENVAEIAVEQRERRQSVRGRWRLSGVQRNTAVLPLHQQLHRAVRVIIGEREHILPPVVRRVALAEEHLFDHAVFAPDRCVGRANVGEQEQRGGRA